MKFEWKGLPVLVLAILIPGLASAQYVRTDLVTNSGAGGTIDQQHERDGGSDCGGTCRQRSICSGRYGYTDWNSCLESAKRKHLVYGYGRQSN